MHRCVRCRSTWGGVLQPTMEFCTMDQLPLLNRFMPE